MTSVSRGRHSHDHMVVGYISCLYISDCSESILDTRGHHSHDHRVVGYISFLYISDCSESILDTLSDVLHEFYLQFTTHLRSAVDNKLLHGHAGFPVGNYHSGLCIIHIIQKALSSLM